jgi:hypothetical protein
MATDGLVAVFPSGWGGLAAPAGTRRSPAGVLLLPSHGRRGLGGIGESLLALFDRRDDLFGHDVLARSRTQHQLEQDPLFELLDGIDDRPPFVPLDGPGGEDAARGEHVDAEGRFADPALPDGLSSLLFVQCSLPYGFSFPRARACAVA